MPLALGWRALAFLAPFALYVASLPPDVGWWDTGEMQTVPYILGIAHPTGFPLFTLAGWLFSHALPFGRVAWRISLLSALAMAGTACWVFELARRLEADPRVALGAAWLFGAGEIAWTRGSRAEVHAVAVFLAVATIAEMVRFRQTGAPPAFRASALWFGLGLANHPVAVLVLPALCAIAWPKRVALTPRVLAGGAALVLACLALYLYLPIRSSYLFAHRVDPTLALGVGPGRPYWDYGHPSTWEGFRREISGEAFDSGGTLAGMFAPDRVAAAFSTYASRAIAELGGIGFGAALLGLLLVGRRDPWVGLGLALACAFTLLFALNYRAESDVDRYFLTSYALLAACAAIGCQRAFVFLAARLRLRRASDSAPAILLAAAVLLGASGALTARNRATLRQAGAFSFGSTRALIDRVRTITPSNAIVVAVWTYATPLGYAAYVDRELGRRIVETAWLDDDRAFLDAWLKTRPVYVVADSAPVVRGYACVLVDAGWPSVYRLERAGS